MSFFTAFLLLVTFVFTLGLYFLANTNTKRKSTKLPPGPLPLPIIGCLLKLGEKPHESLTNLAITHGPLMSLQLGSVTTIVISSSTMAREALQKHDQAFADRTVLDAVRVHRHAEFSMVWLPTCPRWRTVRKLCNSQIFTQQRLDANQSVRSEKVEQLLTYIQRCCDSKRAVDIGQAAFVTSLNLLSNTVFSVDLAGLNSDSGQEFKTLVTRILEEAGKPNLSDYFPLLRPLDLQGIRHRMTIYFDKLDELFDRMIQERLKSREMGTSPACTDFLDTLLDYHSQENGVELGYPDIKALLKDIFVAGTDTSSTTLEWAMAELIRKPKIMAKARLELNETIGEHWRIQESDIVRFPYLQAIVKETMRLHPPVPFLIPHRTNTNVEMCGFMVPKHTQVLINAWAIGRDPNAWDNPASFVPERFLDSNIDYKGRDFELIPFGAGRRICPGLPLAYRMVHLVLASLVHSFDWRLENGTKPKDLDMQDKFGLTLQKAKPLRVVPIHIKYL